MLPQITLLPPFFPFFFNSLTRVLPSDGNAFPRLDKKAPSLKVVRHSDFFLSFFFFLVSLVPGPLFSSNPSISPRQEGTSPAIQRTFSFGFLFIFSPIEDFSLFGVDNFSPLFTLTTSVHCPQVEGHESSHSFPFLSRFSPFFPPPPLCPKLVEFSQATRRSRPLSLDPSPCEKVVGLFAVSRRRDKRREDYRETCGSLCGDRHFWKRMARKRGSRGQG